MRLLLKIDLDGGYENVIPFVYASKEKAVVDLQAAYDKTINAVNEFRRMYTKVCAPRDALYALRNQRLSSNSGPIPQELTDAIAAELKVTDLRNFNKPSEKVDFAGLDLTLDSFAIDNDDHRCLSMPTILTVDEFFADVD